jgi:sugar transferase (PEP-CTERM system associated)
LQGAYASRILLMLVDLCVLSGAFFLGYLVRLGLFSQGFEFSTVDLAPEALFYSGLTMVGLSSVGLYRRRQRPRLSEVVSRVSVAVLIGGLAYVAFMYLVANVYTGRGALAIALIASTVGLIIARWQALKLLDSNPIKRRVLVLGGGQVASKVGMLRRRSDRRGFDVIGYVPVDEREQRIALANGLKPILTLDELPELEEIDEIVVAIDDRRGNFPVSLLLGCKARGGIVTDIVAFLEKEAEQIDLDVMRADWLVFANATRRDALFGGSKRLFDLFFGIAMLGVTLPIFLMIALAIKIEDGFRSSIFYRQTRVGRHGRLYDVLKFRSMVTNAEVSGPQWSARMGDSRVTRVGEFLRRFRLDELPQLINIIRGDMSLVGPRPERPGFVTRLAAEVPFYEYRHCVRPGLTGWAQLNFPYGASVEDARVKHKYDLYYVKNASLLLDFFILLQTLEVVLWGRATSMAGPAAKRNAPDLGWSPDNACPAVGEPRDVSRDVA